MGRSIKELKFLLNFFNPSNQSSRNFLQFFHLTILPDKKTSVKKTWLTASHIHNCKNKQQQHQNVILHSYKSRHSSKKNIYRIYCKQVYNLRSFVSFNFPLDYHQFILKEKKDDKMFRLSRLLLIRKIIDFHFPFRFILSFHISSSFLANHTYIFKVWNLKNANKFHKKCNKKEVIKKNWPHIFGQLWLNLNFTKKNFFCSIVE